MPQPLPLPAEPDGLVYVGDPGRLLATALAYGQDTRSPRVWLQDEVATASNRFEAKLAPYLDLERPWSMVVLGEHPIVHVPLDANAIDTVASLLAGMPAPSPDMSELGAVAIPRASEERGPRIAFLDRAARTLTLANDMPGIATGPLLAPTYGKLALRAHGSAVQALQLGATLPIDDFELSGRDADDFELTLRGLSSTPELLREAPLDPTVVQSITQAWSLVADGALTGLLESPMVALGVSSRYADSQKDVARVLSQAKREVDAQNFLIRGVLEDMLRRFGSLARSWNGRVMVGLGPARHVLVGLGTEDPGKANGAALHLITGVLDNVKLARSFGLDVPNLRLARNWGTAAGSSIHALALPGARRFVPPELQPLVDDRGELKLAFAFPERAGSAALVIGPDSPRVLTRWLEDTAGATAGHDSRTHTLAATLAVQPLELARLLDEGAFALSATRAPTRIVLERHGDAIRIAVRTTAG